MGYLVVAAAFVALLVFASLTVIAITLGYNIEVTFHPPIFIKIKFTRPY
jgi:hypothetical protein